MKNSMQIMVVTAALACAALPVRAAELKMGAGDGVQTVLAAQMGARVTVRTRSGQEITGVVREVNTNVVQIGSVSGKEFFDAVVPLSAVDAVYVRVKD